MGPKKSWNRRLLDYGVMLGMYSTMVTEPHKMVRVERMPNYTAEVSDYRGLTFQRVHAGNQQHV